ncbi:hypothetical protein K402DRAFT_148676 [Aulographum hederae CBS 113979]|uniref:Uncharacterized protein n=1 Tax=Aulographum hederae CBS 113979 TaxID=1176131 RepID=A0A6G1GTM4_9PEZI|nr:hypothetical protein K402DRAFT_148676 [Aulographum hederae CBS 113979]
MEYSPPSYNDFYYSADSNLHRRPRAPSPPPPAPTEEATQTPKPSCFRQASLRLSKTWSNLSGRPSITHLKGVKAGKMSSNSSPSPPSPLRNSFCPSSSSSDPQVQAQRKDSCQPSSPSMSCAGASAGGGSEADNQSQTRESFTSYFNNLKFTRSARTSASSSSTFDLATSKQTLTSAAVGTASLLEFKVSLSPPLCSAAEADEVEKPLVLGIVRPRNQNLSVSPPWVRRRRSDETDGLPPGWGSVKMSSKARVKALRKYFGCKDPGNAEGSVGSSLRSSDGSRYSGSSASLAGSGDGGEVGRGSGETSPEGEGQQQQQQQEQEPEPESELPIEHVIIEGPFSSKGEAEMKRGRGRRRSPLEGRKSSLKSFSSTSSGERARTGIIELYLYMEEEGDKKNDSERTTGWWDDENEIVEEMQVCAPRCEERDPRVDSLDVWRAKHFKY